MPNGSGTSGCIMRQPPSVSYVRVNTLQPTNISVAVGKLQQLLGPEFRVSPHPAVWDVLMIESCNVQPNVVATPETLEIYIDRCAGAAVMRGAQLYTAGILGSNTTFASNDACSLWMDVTGSILRGHKKLLPIDSKVFVGNGRVLVDRNEVFGQNVEKPNGVGVQLDDRVWPNPSLHTLETSTWAVPQHFPSAVAVHVLDPQPGERVLDMCAAPGHKSAHIAALMRHQGSLICVDRHEPRVNQLRATMARLGVTNNVDVLRADSTKIVAQNGNDAIDLLRADGVLVYSTCTLNHGENEQQIDWVLTRWTDMKLCDQIPKHLTALAYVSPKPGILKFDPQLRCPRHNNSSVDCISANPSDVSLYDKVSNAQHTDKCDDTIGFFIAKFKKLKSQT